MTAAVLKGRRLGGSRRRAAALLEVVLSLSILLVAMTVVGATFRNGQYHIELAERMGQADIMTERLINELDLGLIDVSERELTGGFGEESIPGMSWRIVLSPDINLEGIVKVDVYIYMGDPDGPEERRQLLMATHVYRAEPRNIDFERDFGFTQEQIDQLTEAIPGGAALFDPTDFDPRSIAQLPLDTLRELLPSLLQAFGTGALSGGQLDGILQAAQQGDLGALQNLAGQLGNVPGAGQGGVSVPGGGPTPPPSGGNQGRRGSGRRSFGRQGGGR